MLLGFFGGFWTNISKARKTPDSKILTWVVNVGLVAADDVSCVSWVRHDVELKSGLTLVIWDL